MMKDILIESNCGQTRLAALEDGELSEYYVERRGQEKLAGNIYLGRVANILPGMQAAFVDVGLDKNAFLHVGDIQIDKSDFGGDSEKVERQLSGQSIGKMLHMGQEILVQVIKEPGGTKGPRISSHITLPGRLVVLLPTVGYIGVSRRIEDEDARAHLRAMAESCRPEGMGLIVRTAAAEATLEEIRQDVDYLMKLWQSIQTRAAHLKAPALVHRDESLVYRSVRDMLSPLVNRLVLDNEEQYRSARETAEMLSPDLCGRIELYTEKRPLFDIYRIDTLIDRAYARRVWLKSGGYLIIDHAEALTVIDVNTGKFVGSKNLSDTVYKINCEAVHEIVRQLRLRDVGGIIIVDFIDMDTEEHRESLLALLRQELKRDRTKTNLVGLTGLGLVEMTRKKVHQPIHTQLKRPCPACGGSGMVPTDETIARRALHDLRRLTAEATAPCWLITASTGVAGQLLLIGTECGAKVFVRADPACAAEHYDIEPAGEHELPPKTRQLPAFV